jgi:hypothetical protein
MTGPVENPIKRGSSLRDFPYRQHDDGDSDDLGQAARGWLDAVHMFATDALAAGVSAEEVLPAAVQMLEGWMLARNAAALGTTWMALDGAVTALERRLAEVRAERDDLATQNAALLAERRARRERRQRRRGRKGGH